MPPVASTTARARCSTSAPSACRARTPDDASAVRARARAPRLPRTRRAPLRAGEGAAERAHHLGAGRVARVQDAGARVRGLARQVELAGRVAVEARAERQQLREPLRPLAGQRARRPPRRPAPRPPRACPRACSAGESPGPTAPAMPPCAHGLLARVAQRSLARAGRRGGRRGRAPPTARRRRRRSRRRRPRGRRRVRALIGRPRGRRPASARPRGAPASATAGSTSTRCSIVWSACRIFGSVIRFMCGQRLQGRTNSVSGKSTATLSAIEHSVTSTTREGRAAAEVPDHARGRADVVGRGEHVGRALGVGEHASRPGAAGGRTRISSPVKRSCTSQWPFHRMISVFVCEAT